MIATVNNGSWERYGGEVYVGKNLCRHYVLMIIFYNILLCVVVIANEKLVVETISCCLCKQHIFCLFKTCML